MVLWVTKAATIETVWPLSQPFYRLVVVLCNTRDSDKQTNGLQYQTVEQRTCINRAWETKQRAEASIERSLESIGLIDEQPDHDDNGGSGFWSHDSLFT